MNAKSETTHVMRLLKAVTLVFAIILVVPGVEAILKEAGLSSSGWVAYAGLNADVLASNDDPFAALDAIEQQVAAGGQTLPEGFEEEVGVPPGARDLRASEKGDVVSFVIDCEQEEALAQVESSLADGGWRAIPLGGVCGATFVKGSGTFTWMLTTCTQAGAATTVVMRSWR